MSQQAIDVNDLPEEEARLVWEFVTFLKKRIEAEREWPALAVGAFATDWENPEDARYDNWREHYHVPER